MEELFLNTKPDAVRAVERLQVWLNHEILDRVPVQVHRQDVAHKIDRLNSAWNSLKARWFDSEFQVNVFRKPRLVMNNEKPHQ